MYLILYLKQIAIMNLKELKTLMQT